MTIAYTNDAARARIHPRIKEPFRMKYVYFKPATPNPKTNNNGIAYNAARGVKLKFVHGILTNKKTIIITKHIIIVKENLMKQDLTVGFFLLKNKLYFFFNQTNPREDKNNM